MSAKRRFVLCLDNQGYEASLIERKIYEVIPDARAEKDGLVRLVDESGEDYLFSMDHFIFIELPKKVERALVAV